jgi:hypothetical protein
LASPPSLLVPLAMPTRIDDDEAVALAIDQAGDVLGEAGQRARAGGSPCSRSSRRRDVGAHRDAADAAVQAGVAALPVEVQDGAWRGIQPSMTETPVSTLTAIATQASVLLPVPPSPYRIVAWSSGRSGSTR